MSTAPELPTWFPSKVSAESVATCSHMLIEVARQFGFTRETFAVALAQAAEGLVGHDGKDDIDGEALKFVGERLRATADAIERSAN